MVKMAGLLGFSRQAMACVRQYPARHHEALIAQLQEVADGRCDRLMVQMPPGSAKSTYGSVLFPAYFLGRHKRAQIIAVAHTASLAGHFGRQVRAVIAAQGARLGVELAKASRAGACFATDQGGEYFAVPSRF